ncbi:fumarylacetoacetate hydrolase family protein [Actinomadura sp. CNU-125]|uniref:fumarylacetoacetate hydrolase family protein n=1 Tax=Actinomadura sp. CNU-125 TaxID=1904961 RepID=UPI000B03C8BA|nr:fumarylacetoacetate hydrolase family protein [Actinomadura sp. CNU-125]
MPLGGSPLADVPSAAGRPIPLATAVLLPPVVPPVFYAVGLNYTGHIEHALAKGYGAAIAPARPEVAYRANNALTGHGSPIVKPAGVEGRFEAEGEVVAVIGRTLRRATYAEAQESIFGWTIGNDVSARAWQHADRSFWRSKNSDTFKPMGPWIETDVDPLVQTTTMRVDGEPRASFATGAMIFDPYEYVVETTKYITMRPGDVLWMGADGTCQIEPGQTIDIEISGIGVLSNPVHAEEADEAEEAEEEERRPR